jgi:hypothetical protein
MCAKFSILPGTAVSNAQEFERVTLDTLPASTLLIGCLLIVRRHRCGGALSARACGSAPVHFARTGIATTPLIQPWTEWAIFQKLLLVFTTLPLT